MTGVLTGVAGMNGTSGGRPRRGPAPPAGARPRRRLPRSSSAVSSAWAACSGVTSASTPALAAAMKPATDSPRGSPISSAPSGRGRGVGDRAGEEIDLHHAIGIDGAQAALALGGDAAGFQPGDGAVGEAQQGEDFIGMGAIFDQPLGARHPPPRPAPACAPNRGHGSSGPAPPRHRRRARSRVPGASR